MIFNYFWCKISLCINVWVFYICKVFSFALFLVVLVSIYPEIFVNITRKILFEVNNKEARVKLQPFSLRFLLRLSIATEMFY